ncbi:amino acid ABC transporter substrate-binding protein (PAAT family) [Pseudomonas sp. SJZ079]|uniref:substrate-binding periplasmic protein n=1 Tax=Pseudomonas sp. SJZ079 TaxID=2572887 RepID=UPI00119A6495|nr:transporter substrate-binding domain-containing protein [Pseudomonas sp. SJZ079]TWC40114.1 amino acid ABC transporter substrate-binding protein (PAAT family) [Pseudomonas sp. SJZ079]
MRHLLLCLLLTLSAATLAHPWRVIGDEQFAPYSFSQNPDGTPQGLDVELVDAVLREAGVEYRLRLYPWERVKQMLGRGEVEMAFQFAGTPERKAQYNLVGPIRSGITVFMASHKAVLEDWQQLSDLSPYVIGQVRGYAYQSQFDQADLQRDTRAQNPRQLVSMLLAGRIDLIVGDRAQLMHFVHEQHAEQQVRILPQPLAQIPRYVAFAKGDEQRAQRFAAALQRLQSAGTLDAIFQRWGLAID